MRKLHEEGGVKVEDSDVKCKLRSFGETGKTSEGEDLVESQREILRRISHLDLESGAVDRASWK